MDYGFDIINTLYNYLYIVPGLKGYPAFLPLESRYQSWNVTNYGSEKVLKGEPKNKGAEFCVWMDTSSYNGGWSWFDAFDRFKNGVMLISEKTWYGEKDCTHFDTNLLVDSFYSFEPMDVDEDGVCELIGYQYTSLNGHTDYVGSAKTVLKYDKNKSEFVVIDAKFIRCDSNTKT
jgi:hypothetical protein